MLLFVLPSLFAIASGLACFDNGDKEIGGSCYKFVSQQLSFNDARNWCHFQNPVTASYLAYVPNQFTGNFLASYARSAFGQNDGNFWIGLSRRNSSSPWTWDSGLPVVFTNFDGSQLGQNYAAESLVSTKWGTYGNDELKNFVCSYDPTAPPTFGPGTALPETTFRPSSRPIITTTAPNAPTTTGSYDECDLKNTKSTFLFAYSTEINPYVVSNVKQIIVQRLTVDPRRYVKFADVRTDSSNGSVIYWHNDIQSFSSSIDTHPPSKSLMYSNESTDTNIIPLLRSFINTPNVPLCGSFAVVLIKRYTNDRSDFDLDTLLLQLNTQKTTINFIQSNDIPHSGSLGAINKVAGLTGGLTIDAGSEWPEDDSGFTNVTSLLMGIPFTENLLYSSHPARCFNVTNQNLGALRVPKYTEKVVNVTLAITTELFSGSSLQFIALTLVDKTTAERRTLNYTQNDYYYRDTDLIWEPIQLKSDSESDVYMYFSTSAVGSIAVRVFIDKPLPDNWKALSNALLIYGKYDIYGCDEQY